jgi:2-polyprenyl-3-methyl-5-hydroxy-6-metoxy-1,4-benzoquinol methylase
MITERAHFTNRTGCIGCGSTNLQLISSGAYDADPLHGFLSNDPWGESPVPFLRGLSWCYVKCAVCDLAFHQKILTPEWNQRNFERWMSAEAIAEFERTRNTPQVAFERAAHFMKHVLRIEYLTRGLHSGDRTRVLDFGCGNGDFIAQARAFGFDALGVDRSAARRRNNRGTVFESISDVKEPVHAITLFEVLEHLDDPRAILVALAPLLVPGGVLVLETPDCTGVTGISSVHDYAQIHPLQHINGFTPQTLRQFAERLGFRATNKPIAHVTCDPKRVAKDEIKRMLPFAVPQRTQQYFRKS